MQFPARALKGCLVPPPTLGVYRCQVEKQPPKGLGGSGWGRPLRTPLLCLCISLLLWSVILPAVLWALVRPFPHPPDSPPCLSAPDRTLHPASSLIPVISLCSPSLCCFYLPLERAGVGTLQRTSGISALLDTPLPPQLPLTGGRKINLRGPWPVSSPGIKVTVPDGLPPGDCLTLGLLPRTQPNCFELLGVPSGVVMASLQVTLRAHVLCAVGVGLLLLKQGHPDQMSLGGTHLPPS